MISREDTPEAFEEGVQHVTENRWLDPNDLEDPELREAYAQVTDLYDRYIDAVWELDALLDQVNK